MDDLRCFTKQRPKRPPCYRRAERSQQTCESTANGCAPTMLWLRFAGVAMAMQPLLARQLVYSPKNPLSGE